MELLGRVGQRRLAPAASPVVSSMASSAETTRVVFVGDVHDFWSENDVVALKALEPDITVFVGDIGNESVPLVDEISQIELPKAVILGNHDSFYTPEPVVRSSLQVGDPIDKVNLQLNALGDDHIGFSSKQVPNKKATIVGGRPFSGGGLEKYPKIIENLYGYKPEEYSQKIVENVLSAPKEDTIIIVGHNGPTGLGDRRHDICGVDFMSTEGDYGDRDLREALDFLKKHHRCPALVTFGHMHNRLQRSHGILFPRSAQDTSISCNLGGGRRRRVVYDEEDDILYLNVAVVPRVVPATVAVGKKKDDARKHHFGLVEIHESKVISAFDAWVTVSKNGETSNVEKWSLFQRLNDPTVGDKIEIFDTHLDVLTEIIPKAIV